MKSVLFFFAVSFVAIIARAGERVPVDYPKELKRVAESGGSDVKLRLATVIRPLFTSGLSKKETEALLRSEFHVAEKDLNRSSVVKTPLEAVRDGKRLKIVSWTTVELTSFRSFRSFGTKNYVSAQFDFGEQGELVDFSVWPTYGPDYDRNEGTAEPGAKANGPERPWLILNDRRRKIES